MSASAPSARQFFARPRVHIMFLAPMGIFIVLGIVIGIFDRSSAAGWIIAGWMTILTLCFYLPFIWRIRLRLTPKGVRVSAPMCVLEASWDNVEQFYLHGGHAGLVTRAPMQGKGVERLRKTTLSYNPYDEAEYAWLMENRYIPLRGFEHAVKSGAVQQALEAYTSVDAAVQDTPPEKVRIPLKVWIIIGLSAAAGIVVFSLPQPIEGRIDSILQLVLVVAGAVSAICHGLILWRRGARLVGGMILLLGILLGLLIFAAAHNVAVAFGRA